MAENFFQSLYKKHLSSISLVLMLELLHSALWFDFGSGLSKSLFLAHFGFFLLWQPIWNHYKRLSLLNSIIFVSLTLISVYWLNLWSILVWLFLLVGFIGGILKYEKSERNIYMISLMFIVTELLIGCNTQLFSIPLDPTVDIIFTRGMFYIPLLIFFFSGEQQQKESLSVDLLRAISSSLLISLLTLGSLLNMYHSGSDYLFALIQTLLAISLSLVLISWLLSPRLGFSGFSQLWSQSLLNLGTPFETWLNKLYLINQEIDSPSEFLESAMRELISISWVTGIEWQIDSNKGQFADEGKHQINLNINDLNVTIHTRLLAGGALYLHSRLLIQLIENMYTAKVHEHKLAQQAHLEAVHETGARITHDIKNLLQSLKMLTSLASKTTNNRRDTDKLLTTQLPNLTLRLQLALDKLNKPELLKHEYETLKNWCGLIKDRLNNKSVELDITIDLDAEIPADLFDSILDNLLENAYYKQQMDNNINISIIVLSNENELSLCVEDSGKAIPGSIAEKIFKEILPSDSGLGIGLFQATKQAELNGYRLELGNNEDGNVSFKLSDTNKTN